jgi:putative transposase
VGYPRRNIEDGRYYHLYNRGNHREVIFHAAEDYERFLWMLVDAAAEYGVEIGAYCLMPNHYHALVRQRVGGSLVQMMRSFGVSSAKLYNRRYGQVGHLFQERYRTRAVRDEADLIYLSRYIHRNPVELVPRLADYEWSSYRAYLGEATLWCQPAPVLRVFQGQFRGSYASFCEPVKISEMPGYWVTK